MNLYLSLPAYLSQWWLNDTGGGNIAIIKKGSLEAKVLKCLLSKRPVNVPPVLYFEGCTTVRLPQFRNLDTETYCWLSEHGTRALVSAITSRFDFALWQDLGLLYDNTMLKQDLIYAWLEKNDIELTETNYNAVLKRYDRLRNQERSRQSRRREKIAKKNTDTPSLFDEAV